MEFSLSKIAAILLLPLVCLFSGCADDAGQASVTDLAKTIEFNQSGPIPASFEDVNPGYNIAAQDFTMDIFRRTLKEGENSLTSPLSVLYALGMTANGAAGDTLAQMEGALGLDYEQGLNAVNLNVYLAAYGQSIAEDDHKTLQTANSIWLRDDPDLEVKPAFLETNATFYQAGIFSASFDAATVRAINEWVGIHTNRMITNIINELPDEALLCLVNAVAFDGEWADPFEEHQVRPGDFTTAGGETQQVDFMYSQSYVYLENADCTGFFYYYKGGRYAFCALLPNEGADVWEWAGRLDGEQLRQLLAGKQNIEVHFSLPKFTAEYDVSMGEILQAMGMELAFDPELADFSQMAGYPGANIYIGAVLHKARIDVNEQGTKAGAATVVMMDGATASYIIPEYKKVYLDRPFTYMILDRQTELPVFIGVCAEVEKVQ